MSKIIGIEETIYTKDAKMLSDLEQSLAEFQVQVQCYMALHGHSRAGCLALVITQQKLSEIEKNVSVCADNLPKEAQEVYALLIGAND